MKVILDGRACGKTTKIVELVKASGGILICINEREAARIREQYGLDKKHCISFDTAEDREVAHEFGDRPIFIDNADLLLQSLLGVPIHAISATDAKK